MSENLFNVEQFYRFCFDNKLMGGRCKKCGKIHIPPRMMCNNCYSKELQWIQLIGKGEVVTYTIIHVAPIRFEKYTPYIFAIIKLDEGVQIGGIVKASRLEDVHIGSKVVIDFDKNIPDSWPYWSRYYFRPIKES